jgi:murein DD-endopeptidase MepM/ murein hydrolase activator NlpD
LEISLHWNRSKQVILVAILLFISTTQAAAQEGDSLGPTYLVQPGDTLSSIALRFDISVAELISENGINNPDALNVGDPLRLPGIDWIDGTLILDDVQLGDSYLGLRRQYWLDQASFVRLNRITSPNQLYYGFSALLASERGENTNSARSVLAAGQSLLELAIASGENPWSLVSQNQLNGTWEALSGDILFTPRSDQTGPSNLPSTIENVSIENPGFVTGKTAVIRVQSNANLELSGKLIDHELNFFEESDGVQVTLQGISLSSGEGNYTLTLTGQDENAFFSTQQVIRVDGGNYQRETLTVDESLLDPELSAREQVQLLEIANHASPEKLWTGFWGAPHPYIDVINSEFGIARSYNQGSYFGYHFGVDFGGGTGVEIWAPAPGTVIFAEPVELRGNLTILDHGWGIVSMYAHQSEILVSVGDNVQSGQLIGRVGNTGRSSGAHLHWEIWANGVAVEPLDWINLVFP